MKKAGKVFLILIITLLIFGTRVFAPAADPLTPCAIQSSLNGVGCAAASASDSLATDNASGYAIKSGMAFWCESTYVVKLYKASESRGNDLLEAIRRFPVISGRKRSSSVYLKNTQSQAGRSIDQGITYRSLLI